MILPEHRLSLDEVNLLNRIKKSRERPPVASEAWTVFERLCARHMVEDGGMGNARVTQKGQYALKERTRAERKAKP